MRTAIPGIQTFFTTRLVLGYGSNPARGDAKRKGTATQRAEVFALLWGFARAFGYPDALALMAAGPRAYAVDLTCSSIAWFRGSLGSSSRALFIADSASIIRPS